MSGHVHIGFHGLRQHPVEVGQSAIHHLAAAWYLLAISYADARVVEGRNY